MINASHLKEIMNKKGINNIMLINTSLNKLDPNIYYFLGKTFEYCALILSKSEKQRDYLIVPELELGRAREAVKGKKISIEIIKQRDFSELIKKLGIKGRVGINYEYVSVSEYNDLKKSGVNRIKFLDISDDLKNIRKRKDIHEIENIKKAAAYADDIFVQLFKKLYSGSSFRKEKDIMDFLNAKTRESGLKTSFKPIIASGKNSANPHHDPDDILHKGFCVIDFGVKYKGYCSDMTRTIYFGNPTKEEISMYDLVLKANTESIRFSSSGKRCADIDKYCRKILGKHEKRFIHGLGHGIGVEIHEAPTLNSKSKQTLEPGMVVTIEPGVYFKDRYGIRIEDDIVIKAEGNEILTKTTKKLLCFHMK